MENNILRVHCEHDTYVDFFFLEQHSLKDHYCREKKNPGLCCCNPFGAVFLQNQSPTKRKYDISREILGSKRNRIKTIVLKKQFLKFN